MACPGAVVSQPASQPMVYTVEDLNDPELARLKPPPPVNEVVYQFEAVSPVHKETIPIASMNLRNLSITLENRGAGLIRSPYLFGPRGWDFRSLEVIATAVASEKGLTATERFLRLHEWKGLHVSTVLGGSFSPYSESDFAGNPLRVLNQYGHAMCGQSTNTLNSLLRVAPPLGSMYGRRVSLGGHVTGEAFFEGAWHAFDTTPGTGIIQWIYYDRDNARIAPSWAYLIRQRDLVERVKSWVGFSAAGYLKGAKGETSNENKAYPHWDFNFDLRPGESLTYYFDMRGRLDRTSARQDNSSLYRGFSDYGSAVFTYRPDLTQTGYRQYVIAEKNVRATALGLAPIKPKKPSWVVFEARSTWCFAGADIKAWFRTQGEVFIAVNKDPNDTRFPKNPTWQRLSPSQKEYPGASIEGKMAYWVKIQFEGSGSGLTAVEIASEVQMSPWSMPGLEPGVNRVLLEAADLGGSPLRVTYRYDDRSPFHFLQPTKGKYGRLIPLRIGGILQQGSKLGQSDFGKGRFWNRLLLEPRKRVPVLLEIVKVSGSGAGTLVRRLVDKELPYGWHNFWWDGQDDSGKRLPVGMYAYKLSINKKLVHGERLYLYSKVWPTPNAPAPAVPALTMTASTTPASTPTPSVAGLGAAVLDMVGNVAAETEDSEARLAADPSEEDLPMTIESFVAHARFNRARKLNLRGPDALSFSGTLPGLPEGWEPTGQEVEVDAGGAAASFTLDRRGRGRSPSGSLRLIRRRPPGSAASATSTPVSFRLKLRGDFANEWVDEGILSDEDNDGGECALLVTIRLGGLIYGALAQGTLDAVAEKAAKFTLGE